MGRDRRRVGVEVEESAQLRQHPREHRQQGCRNLDPQRRCPWERFGRYPTAPLSDRQGATVAAIGDHLHARGGASGEEGEHRLPGQRRPVDKLQTNAFATRVRAGRAADGKGVQPVPLAKEGVESPHAGKAAGEGDVRHREGTLREQALGQQQALSLGQFDRGHAEFAFNHPPQLP